MTWEEARELAIRQVLAKQAKDGDTMNALIQKIQINIRDADMPLKMLIQLAKVALRDVKAHKPKKQRGFSATWSPKI